VVDLYGFKKLTLKAQNSKLHEIVTPLRRSVVATSKDHLMHKQQPLGVTPLVKHKTQVSNKPVKKVRDLRVKSKVGENLLLRKYQSHQLQQEKNEDIKVTSTPQKQIESDYIDNIHKTKQQSFSLPRSSKPT